jgi:hypothetical protein
MRCHAFVSDWVSSRVWRTRKVSQQAPQVVRRTREAPSREAIGDHRQLLDRTTDTNVFNYQLDVGNFAQIVSDDADIDRAAGDTESFELRDDRIQTLG